MWHKNAGLENAGMEKAGKEKYGILKAELRKRKLSTCVCRVQVMGLLTTTQLMQQRLQYELYRRPVYKLNLPR